MTVAVGLVGLFGCAQQQLGGGPHDGGGPGDDAGCGPLGKMVCVAPTYYGCTTTTIAPVCLNGAWTCPPDVGAPLGCEPPVCGGSLSRGCTCNAATGVTTCVDAGAVCPADVPDGSVLYCVSNCSDHTAVVSTCTAGIWSCPSGTMDLRDCPRDGGAACPPSGADGGFFYCTYDCANDTGVPPAALCVAGTWQCPTGAFKASLCPPTCIGPPAPGCTCEPSTKVMTCQHDGGADAAPGGHGG